MTCYSCSSSSNVVRIAAVILALMTLGTFRLWKDLPIQPGIDLYQFWGIAKCQRSSGYQLGSPYRNPAAYQQQLWKLTLDSGDRRLAFAVANRAAPDLTGTPLIYYLMGSLPWNYTTVLRSYRALQLVVFFLAVFILARPLTSELVTALVFSAALTAAFVPLLFDLAVANVNCFQLLSFLLVTLILNGGRQKILYLGSLISSLLASLLVLISMVKPNFDGVTILLGICLVLNSEGRVRRVTVTAFVVALVLMLLPCVLFRSWSTWSDWWNSIFSSSQRIAYPIQAGNYSGVRLLADILVVPILSAMFMMGALLLLPLFWSAGLFASEPLKGLIRLTTKLRNSLKDPFFCLACGVLLSLALSPLVWEHYHVLAIAPALWLCRAQGNGSVLPRVAGWLSIPLIADLPANFNTAIGGLPAWLIYANHSFSWVLMWFGLVVVLHCKSGTTLAAPRPVTTG